MADLRESAEPEPEPAQAAPRSRVVRVNLPVLKFERIAPRYQLPVMRSFADSIEDAMRDADRRRKLKAAMDAAIRQAQEDDDEEALLLLM